MSFCLNSACLLAMASLLLGVDGYCQYRWIRCYSKSVDLTNMVYVESYFYNKLEYLVFNSTVDQYVGYTDFGKNLAISKNEERSLTYERLSSKAHCQFHAKLHKTIGLNRTVEPSVKVKLVTPFGNGQHPMMVCSAYNFYPRIINLTWYRDGQKVTSDVSTTQMANGDWSYQIHSYVKLNPKAGEKISCVLEHASFKEPREFVWDSSALEADRNKVALGAFGLVLGLVVCAAGLLYYKKKTQDIALINQSDEF